MRRGLGETERNYKDDCIISDREEELIVEFERRLIEMATTDPYVCTLDRARELICEDDIACANEDADRWEFNADLQGWSDESTITKASVIFRNEFYVNKPSNN